MDTCIFCEKEHWDTTVEHIIPRTLGNIHYILPKGKVCARCNNRFARFENKVVSSYPFLIGRAHLGLLTIHHIQNGPVDSKDPHEIPGMDKFLLKVGFEALHHSRKKIWLHYSFDLLKNYLVSGQGKAWQFQVFHTLPSNTKSIPGWIDQWRLKMNKLELRYDQKGEKELHTFFRFGTLVWGIDMLNPD